MLRNNPPKAVWRGISPRTLTYKTQKGAASLEAVPFVSKTIVQASL